MGRTNRVKRICLVPQVSGVGGMVSFRDRLVKGLATRGIIVTHDLSDTPYDTVLVIGGTRDLAGLWRARRRGVPVVQRLDGMNWIHRKAQTGWRHYLRAEYGNLILSLIRARLASGIIYQSSFSRQWWEQVHGKTRIPCSIVHNGVDLGLYSPHGPGEVPQDHVRILLVEGTIGGGYEFGLHTAIQLAERVHTFCSRKVEVIVAGRISARLQHNWKGGAGIEVKYIGPVPSASIPELDRSAHVLYAADLHPACPNAVIEALACGLPVAGFDTGALAEIVTEGSGVIVPYGSDPWKLEAPDINGLAQAINLVLEEQPRFRQAARQRAEEAFGIDRMLDGYLQGLNS